MNNLNILELNYLNLLPEWTKKVRWLIEVKNFSIEKIAKKAEILR